MKGLIALMTVLCLAAGAPALAQEDAKQDAPKEELTTEQKVERFSYGLGLNFGKNLKRQGAPVDVEVVMQGIRDAMGEAEPRFTEEQVREAMRVVSQEMRARREEEARVQGEKNQAAGKAFLDDNAKRKGVTVLPSGLQYEVLREGDGPQAKPTDTVVVHYRGMLIDGTEFDSSHKRGKPATFALNRVIKGWSEGVEQMKVGGKILLCMPPDLAYGDDPRGPGGPNATLVFQVELLEIKAPGSAK